MSITRSFGISTAREETQRLLFSNHPTSDPITGIS